MNCLQVKFNGKVFQVLRREYKEEGILYHLCDDVGKFLYSVWEKDLSIL
jgi:hypothetical protein